MLKFAAVKLKIFYFSKDVTSVMDLLYVKPWTRIGPYVIGFSLGYILYKTECKVKMSKVIFV